MCQSQTENGKLVGILTNRDIRFVEAEDYNSPVDQFMTKEDDLVTARVGISAKEAKDILQKHRIEKLPLVDESGMLERLAYGQGYSKGARLSQRRHRLQRDV